MKPILAAWTAVLLVASAGLSAGNSAERELSLSLGSATGDFRSSLTFGYSLNLPVEGPLRLEPEIFLYHHPRGRSHVPGLAVTSTAVSVGLGYLFRWNVAGRRTVLDIGISCGFIHVSETHKVDSLKQVASFASSQPYAGPSAGVHFRIDGRSGVRFDARFLYLLRDRSTIPRLSIGYSLWY